MNKMKIRTAALVLAAALSGAAQAALHDRGSGLIYDDVLNVTWLQDANYGAGSSYDNGISATDGAMGWENAVAWVANLSYYDSVRKVTYEDWRLPTASPVNGVSFNYNFSFDGSTDQSYNLGSSSELAHMFNVSLGNVGAYTTGGLTNSCWSSFGNCLDNTGPFLNLLPGTYWTGVEYGQNTGRTWHFNMDSGNQSDGSKGERLYAWAVRDGDVAAIPEPETYAMMLAGLGLVGAARQRRS